MPVSLRGKLSLGNKLIVIHPILLGHPELPIRWKIAITFEILRPLIHKDCGRKNLCTLIDKETEEAGFVRSKLMNSTMMNVIFFLRKKGILNKKDKIDYRKLGFTKEVWDKIVSETIKAYECMEKCKVRGK